MTDQQDFELRYALADALAAYSLRNVTDKQGKPLIDHSRRVAAACASLSFEQRIAAILHDTIEDSGGFVTSSLIDLLFGPTVSNLVDLLSRRDDREYQEYIEVLALYPLARPIKLADLTDNLDSSRGPIDASLKARYEKAKHLLEQKEDEDKKARAAADEAARKGATK